jgi:Fe2+ transport system protein B
VAVTKQEVGWKWALLSVAMLLVLSLVVGVAMFQIFSRL